MQVTSFAGKKTGMAEYDWCTILSLPGPNISISGTGLGHFSPRHWSWSILQLAPSKSIGHSA